MNRPGRPISSRDRQILNDLDRPSFGPAQTHAPERLATLGYALPVVTNSGADEWIGLSGGRLSVIRPLSTFDLRSTRFLVKLDTGTDQEIVRFDFGVYIVNPTDWRIQTADNNPVASALNAALIAPLREFTAIRSGFSDAQRRVEIYYERPIRLLGGQFYAFLIAPRVAGEAIWCPSAGDTMFNLDSGNIEEHIQITGLTAPAPAIELRSELGTRVFTGGAPFVRF